MMAKAKKTRRMEMSVRPNFGTTMLSTRSRPLPIALAATLIAAGALFVFEFLLTPASAAEEPVLVVNSVEAPVRPGDPLTLAVSITAPADAPLAGVRVSQLITPALRLSTISSSGGSESCAVLPCELGEIAEGTTALITATYQVAETIRPSMLISHTTVLSATGLTAPREFSATVTVQPHLLRLPLLRQPFPDLYAQWRKLVAPTPGAAVNSLYVPEDNACAGPISEESLPTPLLAATNAGLFQLSPATAQGALPTWQSRGPAGAEVSHIVAGADALYASVFNRGPVLRSTDDGATWAEELLPGNQGTYWLAVSGARVIAAGKGGLYTREGGTWVHEPQLTGSVFGVAAAGGNIYAAQIGRDRDTLWRSASGGAAGTWQPIASPPEPVRFLQMLDARPGATPELLVGTVGGGLYRLGPTGLTAFSQGLALTPYGIWRDREGRVYAALREPGGLQRFAPGGGAGESLSAQSGAPPATERLYTVNGRAGGLCAIIAVGSRTGDVWLRRIP